jgi:fructokinase
MKPDVICLGELLIDFVSLESGVTLEESSGFYKAAGGAPANVAVGLAKMEVRAGFIGKVGDESFGHFLARVLQDHGVDIRELHFEKEVRTALAFVSLTKEGERDFMFYRHPSADMFLSFTEISKEYIIQAKIFHYGSISLITEPSRTATLWAAKLARDNGLVVSYDPNLRLSLWESPRQAYEGIRAGIEFARILKVSEEELEFLTGTKKIDTGSQELLKSNPQIELVVVTLGKKGCYFYTRQCKGKVKGFSVKAVDTTGAGDGFVAGLLARLMEKKEQLPEIGNLNEAQWREIFQYANAVGALTTTRKGAIPGLPTREEVAIFLRTVGKGKNLN